MTPQIEHLIKTHQCANLLTSELRKCYGEADPVCEMLLRPMLKQVCDIEDTLKAIIQSKSGAK